MIIPDTTRVHETIFNWTLSRVRSEHATQEYKQDLVHTLSRMCVSSYHAEEIFKLVLIESDLVVLTTIASVFFHHFKRNQEAATLLLVQLLRHPSLGHRLCGVELVYALVRRRHIEGTPFDSDIAAVLRRYPREESVVHVVARYFLERHSSSEKLVVSDLLPTEGLSWASAIELAFSRENTRGVTLDMVLPNSSQYPLRHMVDLLPHDTQENLLRFVVTQKVRGQDLLTLLRVVLECWETDRSPVIPFLLNAMEELDHTTESECRFLIWDVSWEILGHVKTSILVKSIDQLWELVGRLPEFTLSWSKVHIKKVFTNLYNGFPRAFFDIDASGTCTVEVLPDRFIEDCMDTLVHSLNCGIHHHSPACLALARIKLVCKMNRFQLKRHSVFVGKQLQVLIRGIGDPDVMIRTAFRNLLPNIPDIYFDTLVPFLESIVTTGDQAGMMMMTKFSSDRLRVIRDPIIHRVLKLRDLDDDLILASPALLLLGNLPDDVLVQVVDHLASSVDDACSSLFILREMPGHLLLQQHLEALSFHINGPKARELFLDILVKSKNADVCTSLAPKCVQLLINTSRKPLQHKLIQILLLADTHALSALLHDVADRISARHLCILLGNFDKNCLEMFSENIMDMCDKDIYLERAVYLLGRLPLQTLWLRRERVLGVLQRRINDDHSIDGALHVLQHYGNAGVELARELIRELRFRETLYT